MPGWLDLAGTNHPDHQLDAVFYDRIRARRPSPRPAVEITILPGGARAFEVKAGQSFRVVEAGRPQIGTVALWNAHGPRESFNAARTMAAAACFIEPYVRLWSDVPQFRPLATCIEDTVTTDPAESEFHHHCIGSPCSTQTMERLFGLPGLDSCHAHLERAIAQFGLTAADIHDVVSVHQKTRLDPETGRITVSRSDAKAGDYIEFYAEIDLLVAVSVCPLGDGLVDPRDPLRTQPKPLRVEIQETGVDPRPSPAWADWRPSWMGSWQAPLATKAAR
jgi:uncharacterized protein